tara:strand:+ start:7048 stop:7920 length:873 start_codon:yes stop_codon:yes gene_type:complete
MKNKKTSVVEDTRTQRLIDRFTILYPDVFEVRPLDEEVKHSIPVPEKYHLILNPETTPLQEELDSILEVSCPPPAPTTSHELMMETISIANKVGRYPPSSKTFYGPDFLENYLKYCRDDLRMKISDEQQDGIYRVWNRVTNWVVYAKYTYARPRPVELAKEYGISIKIGNPDDPWSQTPSYPSLRHTLALAAAKYLSHSHASCYPKLLEKAKHVRRYLLRSGANFSSDLSVSQELLQDNIFSAEETEKIAKKKAKKEKSLKNAVERAKKKAEAEKAESIKQPNKPRIQSG